MFFNTGSCPGDTGRGACWGQDVAGQIQAQGATIFLRMELLADTWNRQVGREINLGWLAEQHLPAELLSTRC